MLVEEDKDFHDEIWDAPVINRRNQLVVIFDRILDELIEEIKDNENE